MAPLRFDGEVVIVTGGARGIGRTCVELLAARGARVLLVDVGSDPRGDTSDTALAATVAREVASGLADEVADEVAEPGAGRGAEVVACTLDASTPDGARAIVRAAVERWGRVDALIANAGVSWSTDLVDVDERDLASMFAVNAAAPLWLAQSAWPHLAACGAGRIVTVASAGLFGYPGRAHYAMSKGAIVGLTRSLALEGRRAGITANCVFPWALTRMATGGDPDGWMAANIPPVGPAAVMVWLAHRSCVASGEMFAAAGRHVARVGLGVGAGAVVTEATPEAVAVAIDAGHVPADVTFPASTGRYVADIVRPALAPDEPA